MYKFVFEGSFTNRLQPSASAVLYNDGATDYLRVSVTVENIGKKEVKLDPSFTRLSVRLGERGTRGWSDPTTFEVLEEEEYRRWSDG